MKSNDDEKQTPYRSKPGSAATLSKTVPIRSTYFAGSEKISSANSLQVCGSAWGSVSIGPNGNKVPAIVAVKNVIARKIPCRKYARQLGTREGSSNCNRPSLSIKKIADPSRIHDVRILIRSKRS